MFRRRRRGDPDNPEGTDDVDGSDSSDSSSEDTDSTDATGSPGATRIAGAGRERGPWDLSEVDDPAAGGRVDLGGIWLPGRQGLEVRIEADQATSEVVAVTLVLAEGALQVQPFAAPRTGTIWDEVRAEIRAGITKQGGTADEVTGPLGIELRTRVPVRAQDGTSGVQPARFIGVDGPRWFLRGVLTGRVAVEDGDDDGHDGDDGLIGLFRDIVVVRGESAMAPRDPIPLALPPTPVRPDASDDSTGTDDAQDKDSGSLKPFERGPEITEIH